MNIENLKRTLELLDTIDESRFDIEVYRANKKNETDIPNVTLLNQTQECESVGCIIGHATVLDTHENWSKFIIKQSMFNKLGFRFHAWSEDFFSIESHSDKWNYIFSADWGNSDFIFDIFDDYSYDDIYKIIDSLNTINHAKYRIQKVIDGYEPKKMIIELRNEGVLIINKQ